MNSNHIICKSEIHSKYQANKRICALIRVAY